MSDLNIYPRRSSSPAGMSGEGGAGAVAGEHVVEDVDEGGPRFVQRRPACRGLLEGDGGPLVTAGLVIAGAACQQSAGGLAAAGMERLRRGLQMMAPAIEASEERGYVIIEIGDASYTPADYQPAGLAVAMIGWVPEEFGLESLIRDIHFGTVDSGYVFSV